MASWEKFTIKSSPTIFDIWGEQQTPLYIASDQGIFSSKDLGESWKPVDTKVNGTFMQISGTKENLYLAGQGKRNSFILHSKDRKKWRKLKIGNQKWLRSIAVLGDHIYAVCFHRIIKSENQGKDFYPVFDQTNSFANLWCPDPQHIFCHWLR